MKAIYTIGKGVAERALLCEVLEDDGEGVVLEPLYIENDEDNRFWVGFDDPCLTLDPTDGEMDALQPPPVVGLDNPPESE